METLRALFIGLRASILSRATVREGAELTALCVLAVLRADKATANLHIGQAKACARRINARAALRSRNKRAAAFSRRLRWFGA